jgi:hypothetical protein
MKHRAVAHVAPETRLHRNLSVKQLNATEIYEEICVASRSSCTASGVSGHKRGAALAGDRARRNISPNRLAAATRIRLFEAFRKHRHEQRNH